MDRLTQIIIYFLGPTSWLDYVWKVSLLASFATFGAVGIEALFGVDIASRLPIYLAITIGISVPFFSAAMLLVLRLLKLQKQLDYFARTDVLTGLDNRRAFFAQTDQMQGGALILLDVDHFKDVNDTYGHAVGAPLQLDAALKAADDALYAAKAAGRACFRSAAANP